jgi:serine/threonine-protein kinase
VLDFGVAKAEGQIHSTRTGQLRGKLAYMAPEHLRDSATKLSDVYSAGVVLWEALSGRRMFTAQSDGALVTKVLDGNIPELSSVAPDVPPALAQITHRALSMDAAHRFASAELMADALEDGFELAKPAEVGALVSHLGSAEITRLRRLIAMVEAAGEVTRTRTRSVAPPSAPQSEPIEVGPVRYLDSLREQLAGRAERGESTLTGTPQRPTLTDAGMAPEPSASLVSGAPTKAERQVSGRLLPLAALLAVAAAAAWVAFQRPPAVSDAAPTEASPAPAADIGSSAAAASPAPNPSASESAPPPAITSEPSASVSASVQAAPRLVGPAPKSTASVMASTAPSDCNELFEIDQNGVKRVKVKCVKVTR